MTEQSAGELLREATEFIVDAYANPHLREEYRDKALALNTRIDAWQERQKASERADGVMVDLEGKSTAAYREYIRILSSDECKGWGQKAKEGKFGAEELKAHMNAAEQLGKHRAYSEAVTALNAAPAASVGAPSREQVLHEVIRMVRMSPEYDHGGPFAAMMDQALAGKTPHLLVSVSYLQRGLKPPEASVSADARDAGRLADDVWGSWLERLHPLDRARKDGFSHHCRHCTLLLKSPSGWHLARHDDDCLVNIAAKHSPEAQSQAVKDAAMEKK